MIIMQARSWLLSLATMMGLCALLAGCDDPYVQRAMQHDRESMAFAINSYAEREARCSENLAAISRDIEGQLRDDAETFPRSAAGVGEYFRMDVEEWPEKTSLPRDEFLRILAGDMETIMWTLPRLAF
jgi:hypothetical protein